MEHCLRIDKNEPANIYALYKFEIKSSNRKARLRLSDGPYKSIPITWDPVTIPIEPNFAVLNEGIALGDYLDVGAS